MLRSGLYEQVINRALDQELSDTADQISQTALIDSAEASKVLSKYIAEIIEQGLDQVRDNGGEVEDQIVLANKLVSVIATETGTQDFAEMSVAERAEQLLALLKKKIVSMRSMRKRKWFDRSHRLRRAVCLPGQYTSHRYSRN